MNVDGESTASMVSSAVSQATSVVADVAATASAKVTAPSFPYSAHDLPLPRTSVLLHPASILFFTALFANILKKIGKDRMVGLISPLHLQLTSGKVLRRQKQLKRELFEARQEMAKTSSQDEFAKWAKLRRKVDKTLADLEAINTSLSGSRSSLGLLVRGVLFILGTAFPFVVSTYYRKTPIFWLPPAASLGGKGQAVSQDWLGPIGWMLALPSAPRGSISATVWSQVCARVIALVFTAIYDLLLFVALIKDPNAPPLVSPTKPGRALITSTPLRLVWCAIGLATCSFAYTRLLGLGELLGVDLSAQFGGLWQYLTNLGLVATAITLLLSLTDALLPSSSPASPSVTFKLKELSSIIALPGETLIFLLYWSIMLIKPELMVPSRQVDDPANPGQLLTETIRLPLSTDLALHGIPAVFLLVEHLLFSPSFPTSAKSPATLLGPFVTTIAYCLWVEYCATKNGHFPYPLLELMSVPARGALYVACSAVLVGVLKALEGARAFVERRLAGGERVGKRPVPVPASASTEKTQAGSGEASREKKEL